MTLLFTQLSHDTHIMHRALAQACVGDGKMSQPSSVPSILICTRQPNGSRISLRGPENMFLLNFPIEIRLGIYSELLVQDSHVEFGADFGPCDPYLIRFERRGLNPAILRVNSTVNREAISFLYSVNHFRFPNAYTSQYHYRLDIGSAIHRAVP